MATVKILVDHVGSPTPFVMYMAGDIVEDAPAGLVEMAEKGTTNAATGERIAELVDGSASSEPTFAELKAQAKALGIEGYSKMKADQLKEAITAAGSDGVSNAVQSEDSLS